MPPAMKIADLIWGTQEMRFIPLPLLSLMKMKIPSAEQPEQSGDDQVDCDDVIQ
jgi:hypothetical protein